MKIVYFDLDGSLLNINGELSDDVFNSIQRYISVGGRIGLATGRSYMECKHLLERISPNLPSFLLDGNIIYNSGKANMYYDFPGDLFYSYEKMLEEHFYIVEEHIDYYLTPTKLAARLFKKSFNIDSNYIKIQDRECSKTLVSIYLMSKDGTKINDYKLKIYDIYKDDLMLSKFAEAFNFIQMNDYWVNIYNLKADKEICLDYLKKHYQIEEKDIAFFANDLNDVNMFKRVGYKIALLNSNEKILVMSDIIIENNQIPYILEQLQNKIKN